MWKKLLAFALFIVLCFMMPCFFIDFTKINPKIENNNESSEISNTQSGEKIKLLLNESNEVIEITINDYIKGVVLRGNAYNL